MRKYIILAFVVVLGILSMFWVKAYTMSYKNDPYLQPASHYHTASVSAQVIQGDVKNGGLKK